MPVIPQSQVLQSRSAAMTNLLDNPDHPLHNTAGEIWSGAMNEANLTWNAVNFLRRNRSFPADLSYEVEKDEEIRPWFEMYSEEFRSVLSKAEAMSIVERIEKNNEHRRVLATSGAAGVMATIASGVLDPVNLIPVGWIGKAFQGSRLAAKAFAAAKYGVAAADDAVKLGVKLLPEEVNLLKVGVPEVKQTVGGEIAARRSFEVYAAEEARDAAARKVGAPVTPEDVRRVLPERPSDALLPPSTVVEIERAADLAAAEGRLAVSVSARDKALAAGEARVAQIRTSHAAALGKIAKHKEHLVKLAKEAGEGLPTPLSAAAKGGGKAAAVGAGFGAGSEVILQALQEGRDEDLIVHSAIAGAALGAVLGGLGAIPHGISQARLNRVHMAMIEDLTAGDVFSRMPESAKFTLEEIRAISKAGEAASKKDVPRGTSAAGGQGKATPQAAADEVKAAPKTKEDAVADAVADRVGESSPDMGAILKDEESPLRRALTRWGLSPAGRGVFAVVDEAAKLMHALMPSPFLQRKPGEIAPAVAARAQVHVEIGIMHAREIMGLQGKLDYKDFSRGIANVLRTGDVENVAPEVVQAAGILKGYFAKWEEALKKDGLLPEDFDLGKDFGYFPRLYDFAKILANRSAFVKLIAPDVGGIDEAEEIVGELLTHGPNALSLDPFNATGATARLKARGLAKLVPSAKIADYLIDDVAWVIERYSQQVGAQLELAKLQKVGTVSERLKLTEFLGDAQKGTKGIIEVRYDELIAASKNDKQKARLLAEKKRILTGLEYVRHSILGDLHRDPFEGGSRAISGAATTAASFAYLGNAGFNSLNDIVAPIFRDGAKSYFRVAAGRMRRSLKSLAAEGEKDELTRAAWLYQWLGAEHSRSGMLFDSMGDSGTAPRGRGGLMRRAHNTFMFVNLMRPVTAFASEHSTYMAIDTLLRASKKLSDGVALSRVEKQRLNLAGLDEATASRIGKEMQAGGAVNEGGIWLPMLSKWGDQELGDTFRAAVIQSNRHGVLNPLKGEIPMAFNNPLGRVMFQFLSWPLQATQTYLIAGLQRRDAAAISGALAMTGMGMFIVAVNAVARGEEVPDLDDLVSQGIERGGALGLLTDLNGWGSRMTGGMADLNQVFGTETVAGRYGPMEGGDAIPGLGIIDRVRKDLRTGMRLLNGEEIGEQEAKAFARRRFMMNAVYMSPIRGAIQEAVQSD